MKVIKNYFSVFRSSYDACLRNLARALTRCKKINLLLNWEKYYFMVLERVVLGHRLYRHRIEVVKVKVEVVERLPPHTSVKNICSFIGHTCYYRRFIKYFSKIITPLCRLLIIYVAFHFNEAYLKVFEYLKKRRVVVLIIVAPD